jgi:putative hydrolase of the HAD superfamily
MIQVVFLDAGETILHPHPSWPELFATTCSRRGIDVDPEVAGPILFTMLRDTWNELASEAGVTNPSVSYESSYRFWTFAYRRCLEKLGIEDEELPDVLYKVFSDTATYRLYDDALPAIEELTNDGFRIGLISNFEGWLEEMLVELRLGDVFEISIISGLVGVEKPDARIYELALEAAGVPPQAAVHVGDSIKMDVEPALAAGMKAVLIDRSDRHHDHDGLRVRSLSELPRLVAVL